MTGTQTTLTADFTSNEPYGWLPGDDSYQFPQEVLDEMSVPEIHSMRILASYDEDGFFRMGAYMMPPFVDPSYGVLTLAEREFIGVVVSSTNSCTTCLVYHGHQLGQAIGDHGRARRIGINYRAVELNNEERAIADYCVKMTEHPGRMEQADIRALLEAGVSDTKIYYIIELIGLFNLTNRLTSAYGMRLDDDFMESISPKT